MESKILNPETNRFVKIGGAVYDSLVSRGVIVPGNTPLPTKKTKKFIPPTDYQVTQHFKNYPVDRSQVAWGEKKPQKVRERKLIKQECGDSCFLKPQDNAFPICNKTLPCTYNCRGLKGASARAGEWKYEKVLQKSKELTEKLGCYKKKK